MIIPIKRDRNAIKINTDFASAVPEFAEVLNDTELGNPYMAYVAYLVDPSEENIWFNMPEEMRGEAIVESLSLDKKLVKSQKVGAAIKKYKQFCDNNISYKFKAAHQNGMKKIAEFIESTPRLDENSAKEFAAVLDKMPSLLKGGAEIDKLQSKDSKSGHVRGNKQLTLNERM